jgi:hypothetical protein
MLFNSMDFARLVVTAGAAIALGVLGGLVVACVVEVVFQRRFPPPTLLSFGEADHKARSLLKQWLSPEQLKQFETTGCFEVVGCDTGKRYRIHRYSQMNIEELDERGMGVTTWCFLPEGKLPVGDVMLAQKIALETDERTALAIANRVRRP